MKRKEHFETDERIQRAWTALSARFYFVLLAAEIALGAVKWTQTGEWLAALPEMIGTAVGAGAAVLFLTAGKAWLGRDEAVSQRRCLSLHAAFFYMFWVTYIAIFVVYFVNRQNHVWHLLSMTVVGAVYFARRILAAKCGLILHSNGDHKRRSTRWFRNASIILGIGCAAMFAGLWLLMRMENWWLLAFAVVWGLLLGWLFWRYYLWLVKTSEKKADEQLAAAEAESDEE